MRAREAGFTTIELVIAVAITIMLLAAGGVWLLSMQPGSLRGAVNDVDADLGAAQSIAESSGNGTTLVFAPRAGGVAGFTLRVYSGRPNAASAVTATTTMEVTSATAITEAHFGSPPFTIFLNSAGYATGAANYPTLDAQENPTFTVIAQQPPCPSGGIVLTFTSPQGATATRTLACNTMVAGTSAASATPTPNPPHISPTYLIAHDTTDANALRFKDAEYGYYHWYASTQNGSACETIASQTGAAPASFASPWPYAQASPAAQSGASPAPPAAAPYTWPVGDLNDPPAWFQLEPTLHDGGLCTVTVADDYNQSGQVTVQVMGDLTASTTALSLQVGKGSQTVDFTKAFDSEKLMLSAGGPCLGIVTTTSASGSFPSSPSNTPASGSVTVTPVAKGSCVMQVEDQYGEIASIAINVKAAQENFLTWPASLVVGASGDQVGTTTGDIAMTPPTTVVARIAPILNTLLGGAVARAAAYSGACYAQAFQAGTAGAADTSLITNNPSAASALGITVTTDGCILNADGSAPYGQTSPGAGTATGVMVPYEPAGSGQTGYFGDSPQLCGSYFSLGNWYPTNSGAQASVAMQGSSVGSCVVNFTDGSSTQTPAPDVGQVAVNVVGCPSGQICVYLDISAGTASTTHCNPLTGVCTTNPGSPAVAAYFWSTDGGSSWNEYESDDNYDCAVGPPATPVTFTCTATQTAPSWRSYQATYSGGFAFGGDGAGTLWGGATPPSNIEDEFDALMCQWYRNTWAAEPPGGYPGC